ncbi:hypothetical protein MMC07_009719 [Pseudocyphellaria aurata]|nr:hypothetical protein [Pseudocyphellaria aurata]
MPPQRSIPPSKAIKTERTHEENQERAYIAASRRSDRSLEARVESARRASEIHKRRTGRSLRVTEQDVINEEMYEEEDDDLPMQYRRLTAHLQTGSADFNRRLSAYLTNHVAMRSALDQAITNSYAQQYPNAPQFAHNNHAVYPSPFMMPNMPPQPPLQPYVQPTYNTATGTPSFRPAQHFRSASIPGPPQGTSVYGPNVPMSGSVPGPNPLDQRRMSMPAKSVSPAGSVHTPIFASSRPPLQHATSSYNGKHSASPHFAMSPDVQSSGPMPAPPQPQSQPLPQPQQRMVANPNFHDFSPLSGSLPPESQLMLGACLDPNDPFTSMLMAGNEYVHPGHVISADASKRDYHASHDGMSATLAPSALDMSPGNVTNSPSIMPGVNPGHVLDFGPDYNKSQFFSRSNSSPGSGSGTGTPIDASWEAFINDSPWTDIT